MHCKIVWVCPLERGSEAGADVPIEKNQSQTAGDRKRRWGRGEACLPAIDLRFGVLTMLMKRALSSRFPQICTVHNGISDVHHSADPRSQKENLHTPSHHRRPSCSSIGPAASPTPLLFHDPAFRRFHPIFGRFLFFFYLSLSGLFAEKTKQNKTKQPKGRRKSTFFLFVCTAQFTLVSIHRAYSLGLSSNPHPNVLTLLAGGTGRSVHVRRTEYLK